MDKVVINKLINEAKNIALQNTCCSYSKYSVGVALLSKSNKVYTGFNIENNGLQSICAERVAFCRALVNNERNFKAIVVVGKNLNDSFFQKTLPCGYCRQFLSEYATPDLEIYTFDDKENKLYKFTLRELLPEAFLFKGDN